MRLVGRSFRAHPVPHAIAFVGAVMFAVAVVALSRAFGWVTDNVITPGLTSDGFDRSTLLAGFIVILAIASFRGLGAVLRRYYLSMAESRTKGTWRSQIYHHYVDQPVSFHRQRPTGELIAHADNDLVVAGIMLRPLAFAIATVVLALLAIVSLSLVHWTFGLVAVVVLPILFGINRIYSTRVARPAAEVQQAVAEVTGVAHESFDGVMVVKTLGRTEDEVERMRAVSDDLKEKRLVVGRLRAVFEPLLEVLPNLGIIVLLILGANLVSNGDATVGDVVGAMSLFSVLGLPIRIVGFFLQSMPASVVALDRVDQIIDLPLAQTVSSSAGELPAGPLPLSFTNVHFAHDDHVVLDGLDLHVDAGETVALVGATGSGKTTMLELAAGLVPSGSGSVTVADMAVDELTPTARAARVGMVFQESYLFARSIRENIRMGQGVVSGQVEDAARRSRAHGFIGETPEGYDTVVGERGVTVSGGQRQRIALARALFRSPSLLLLDDATSAVDPTIESEILSVLTDQETTVLIVAHRLSTILLADRVAFLHDGKIAATGTHHELLANEGYRTLVQAYENPSGLAERSDQSDGWGSPSAVRRKEQ